MPNSKKTTARSIGEFFGHMLTQGLRFLLQVPETLPAGALLHNPGVAIWWPAWLLSLINRYFGPSSGFGRVLGSLGFGVGPSELASYLIGLALIGAAIYALGLVVHSRLGAWVAF